MQRELAGRVECQSAHFENQDELFVGAGSIPVQGKLDALVILLKMPFPSEKGTPVGKDTQTQPGRLAIQQTDNDGFRWTRVECEIRHTAHSRRLIFNSTASGGNRTGRTFEACFVCAPGVFGFRIRVQALISEFNLY